MSITFTAMTTRTADHYRANGLDANAMVPERGISDGSGYPCRHCLRDIEKGREMLLLAYRPFESIHPYSETGPVFLCAQSCARYQPSDGLPKVLKSRQKHMVRACDEAGRIIDGTGQQVMIDDLEKALEALLADNGVAFAHIRSGTNTCFTCKVERTVTGS